MALWPEAVIPGALHIVSTPIGHLGDITLRALAVLQQAAAICCEDTRHARPLLDRYGIGTPTLALHEHNEASVTPRLIERLQGGEPLALISDAGTPLVSDPGARLVETAAALGIRIVPVPGASATLAALVASGLAPHPFTVLGFLDRKGKDRENQLALAARLPHSVVVFESPNRLVDTLRAVAEITGGQRHVAVARELTKHFEEIRRGTLAEVAAYYEAVPPRGEIVLVLAGAEVAEPSEDGLRAVAGALREQGFRPRDIVRMLMDEHGASRNLAYRLAHDT
ncbi:16S rRNA (cytidine(1402)-2'-O)-methyltransferase [Gemmatimonas aurantiaca]|uniref:16S rRNA (cytidine(1402)-2'-O)-methyltransferase n=1 Tax=Gemmatimonas aurantiaca TaxID=173480 RepID=UPI00301CA649